GLADAAAAGDVEAQGVGERLHGLRREPAPGPAAHRPGEIAHPVENGRGGGSGEQAAGQGPGHLLNVARPGPRGNPPARAPVRRRAAQVTTARAAQRGSSCSPAASTASSAAAAVTTSSWVTYSGAKPSRTTSGTRKSPMTPRAISAWTTPYASGCRSDTCEPRRALSRGVTPSVPGSSASTHSTKKPVSDRDCARTSARSSP